MDNSHTDDMIEQVEEELNRLEKRIDILAEKLGVVFDDEKE